MGLDELHSLIDFGVLVVLWLVQLIIYPAFLKVAPEHLVPWHSSYTFRVSFIIIPLMFAQLGLALWAVGQPTATALDGVVLGLVALCWVLTFFVSVPLHRRIAQGRGDAATCRRLVLTNWPRTTLWTVIFLLGLLR